MLNKNFHFFGENCPLFSSRGGKSLYKVYTKEFEQTHTISKKTTLNSVCVGGSGGGGGGGVN